MIAWRDIPARSSHLLKFQRAFFRVAAATCILVFISIQGVFAYGAAGLAPVTNADGRLGLCDVLAGSPPGGGASWAELAANAGARANRWEFRWDRIEKSSGAWNFSADDPVVASDQLHGLSTLGILIGTPRWGAAPGQKAGNGVPAGLYLDPSNPGNLWATYVRVVVQHYAGEVTAWEIWNEPDLSFFWAGSPTDYFRLLKVADLVITATDPSAQVVMAGMVVPDMAFFTKVLAASRSDPGWHDNRGYFDVAAWHAYGPARLVYGNIQHMRSLLNQEGDGASPIWVTEAGFPASNPNGEPRQAAYVLQAVTYALAAGASRVFVYRASDDSLPKTWGLLTSAGAPRQAYIAFSVAAAQLSGATTSVYAPLAHIERFAFYSGASRITVLWNHDVTDRPITVTASGATAQLIDWAGNVTPLQPGNGVYKFTLPGAAYNIGVDAPGSVVGGPPVFLVEDDSTPAVMPLVTYIRPGSGSSSRVLVLNAGTDTASAYVRETGHPRRRVLLTLKPSSARLVDMSLLGSDLSEVSSTAPLTAWGLVDSATSTAMTPSSDWWLPSVSGTVTLSNQGTRPTIAALTAFGPNGRSRSSVSFQLKARSDASWSPPPALRSTPLSVSVHSTGTVLTWRADGRNVADSSPTNTWYAIHPGSHSLSVFNPAPAGHIHVQVNFVGRGPVKSEQLELGPYKTASVDARNARAASVTSDSAVVAGFDASSPGSAVVAKTATRLLLSAAGSATRVDVFNPGTASAHVEVQVVNRERIQTITSNVPGGKVAALTVRKPGDGPRGVILSSDKPVAAAPVS